MQKEIKLKFDAIRPFGPTVIKGKVPDNILNIVNLVNPVNPVNPVIQAP